MPKVAIDLNAFSPAAAEAIYYYGRYMEDPSFRNDNSYYWARLASWYLGSIGIPGRPSRMPTQSEWAGMSKIPILRRSVRSWLAAELGKGRSASDLALMRETVARFTTGARNDPDIVAALAMMRDQLGTDHLDVAPTTPSFNELWNRTRGIDDRPLINRLQSMHEVDAFADTLRAQEQQTPPTDPSREYEVIRVEDMLGYLDHYDSPEVPLDLPTTRDHQYGPAPAFGGV